MALVVNPLPDLVVKEAQTTTVNLFNTFDDSLTTGLVARFELYDSSLGGGVTNIVLFDQVGEGAPLTVHNFRNYVEDGDYTNSVIHRSMPGFVLQGGGFTVDGLSAVLAQTPNSGADAVEVIPANPPVPNEFSIGRSNQRGTIAMAKLGGDPNSATNQWFFNLADNSANLDNQNGGFTVFGQVLSTADFAPLDAIAALPRYNGSSFFAQPAFTNLPLQVDDPANPTLTGDENFVRYRRITVAQTSELQFAVVSNSNPELVNATIQNNQLVLDYQAAPTRTAEVTIRATNLLGQSIEDTFLITVEASTAPVISPNPTNSNPEPQPDNPNPTPAPNNSNPTLEPNNPNSDPDPINTDSALDPISSNAAPDPGNIPTAGADTLIGTNRNDVINGLGGNDRISGLRGNDRLLGGQGADRIVGGAGNDILQGGVGKDSITTGQGRDRIVVGRKDGFDVVQDFSDRRDRIELVGGLSFGQLSFQQRGNDTLVQAGKVNLLRLENINPSALSQTDFV
jgi:peptidyl-prolyl cis-trans isomerase A (cyclophilin A)